jgi:hypothetical protein
MDDGADNFYRGLAPMNTRGERWHAPARRVEPFMLPCLNAHRRTLAMQLHQRELLQGGEFHIGRRVRGDLDRETIERLTVWITERQSIIRAIETGATI